MCGDGESVRTEAVLRKMILLTCMSPLFLQRKNTYDCEENSAFFTPACLIYLTSPCKVNLPSSSSYSSPFFPSSSN